MFNADGMRRKPLLVLFMLGFAPAALVVVIRCASLGASLNTGGLPPGYFAMAEQIIGGPVPDAVALQTTSPRKTSSGTPHRRLSVITSMK